MAKTQHVCSHCGGENVKWDAWAEWDFEAQQMVLSQSFSQAYCDDCDGETSTDEVLVDEAPTVSA